VNTRLHLSLRNYDVEPDERRINHVQEKYGMKPEEFLAMCVAQNGGCAICGESAVSARNGRAKYLCVDHCHETGKVRGLLCGPCNLAIGNMRDNPALLRLAASYLER
jgi:hypothetical protein